MKDIEVEIHDENIILTLKNVGFYTIQNLEADTPDEFGIKIEDNYGTTIIQAVLSDDVIWYFLKSVQDLLEARKHHARGNAQGS